MVKKLKRTESQDIIKQLQPWFNDYGYPRTCRSDGGPQLVSQLFKEFCQGIFMIHEKSSAYNPQSNGLREVRVKNIKKLILKAQRDEEDVDKAIAEWKNVNRSDGSAAPSTMFFKRILRGQLPSLPRETPSIQEMEEQRERVLVGSRQREYRHAGKTPISVGDHVLMQDHVTKLWKHKGVIASSRDRGVSYKVIGIQGRTFTCNRQQLKLQPPLPSTLPPRDATPPKQRQVKDIPQEVDDTAFIPPRPIGPRRGGRNRQKRIQWDV